MPIRRRLIRYATILLLGSLQLTAASAQKAKLTPAQDCASVCTRVGATPQMVQRCHCRVAPHETRTLVLPKDLPSPVPVPVPLPSPQGAIASPIEIFNPVSSNCWISEKKYCVYKKPGKTGYACTCGRISGYFN